MDKNHLPKSFGAFKPVNHVVVAFPSVEETDAAARELVEGGVADIVRYTPEEMIAQANDQLATASPFAAVGQELNLVRTHRALAQSGHSFLVVPAVNDDQAQKVAQVARDHHATRAQRYGRLLIEELIEVGDGSPQVGESPDRGLDTQSADGLERRPPPQQHH